jgi:hypothetical protein
VIQPSACGGGVMLSRYEQKTRIGERMLPRSMRTPSEVTSCAMDSLLPMKRLATMYWNSASFRKTGPPQSRSKPR